MEGMTKSVVGRLVALFALLVVAHSRVAEHPASSYFNICPRGDSNMLEECVKNNIIDLKPHLKKGFPALGVMPLEPLSIPRMDFKEGGAFALDTTLTNVKLRGVGDFSINNVNIKLDEENFFANISFSLPDMRIVGDYNMDGRILLLPISGNGNFEINATYLITELTFTSKAVTRNGKKYFEIVDSKCNLILNGVSRSWFYNLFNGQKVLGDATNAFLNNNYKETNKATKHLPEGAFAKLFKEIVSKIFNVYPIDELFTK